MSNMGGDKFTFGTFWNSMTEKVAPPPTRTQPQSQTNTALVVAAFFVLAIVMLGIFNVTSKKI